MIKRLFLNGIEGNRGGFGVVDGDQFVPHPAALAADADLLLGHLAVVRADVADELAVFRMIVFDLAHFRLHWRSLRGRKAEAIS